MTMDHEFVRDSFRHPEMVTRYAADVDRYGLWLSERLMFERHIRLDARILELGCGAGRATFGLYELGYTDITGIDLSDSMIVAAKHHAALRSIEVSFSVGDATDLRFDTLSFDVVFFSYNGLMTIPTRSARQRAFGEINRVLVPGGTFFFTTHDRSYPSHWDEFWVEEIRRWQEGIQDPRVPEFGDRVIDHHGLDTFIHFPDRQEILDALASTGFVLIEDAMRSEIATESAALLTGTGDCRFWVARAKT